VTQPTPEVAVPEPADAGFVDFADTSFTPETSGGSGDGLRMFRMSQGYPQKPIDGRKFQLYGKERIAFLQEDVYHFFGHRFNQQHMGSAVNGMRRCTMEKLGHCVCCTHFENAGTKPDPQNPGRTKKDARCGRRQQQFACNVVVYKTNEEGVLLDASNQPLNLTPQGPVVAATGQPGELVYEVFIWRFSSDKFVQVRDIKQQWSTLLNNDLMLTLAPGKPENFQDFTATVLPNSAWKIAGAANRPFAEQFVKYYKEEKYDAERIFGKEYTDDEMLGFLGLGGGGAGGPVNVAAVTADIEAEIAALTSGAPAATAPPPPPVPPPAPVAEAPIQVPAAETVVEPAVAPPAPQVEQPAVPPVAPPATTDFDALLNAS
jgi:hypothetical protein